MLNLVTVETFFNEILTPTDTEEFESRHPQVRERQAATEEKQAHWNSDDDQTSVLVVYSYYEQPRALQNFEFFLEQIKKYDNLRPANNIEMYYRIVVNNKECTVPLPEDNPRFHVVRVENTGSDFNAYYVALEQCIVNKKGRPNGEFCTEMETFDYFFFINSSCRGPFLAPYLRNLMHWTTPFTTLLSDTVKLVGPSLHLQNLGTEPNPLLDGYLLATDYVGLNILLDAGVFAMHPDLNQTVYFGEMGASRSILAAGFNLETLASQYHGFDWLDKKTVSPTHYARHFRIEFAQNTNQIRGSSGLKSDVVYALHPYETIFIKTVWGESRGEYMDPEQPLWRQDQPLQEGHRLSHLQEEILTRTHFDRDI